LSKTAELKSLIETKLLTKSSDVYYRSAPDDSAFPYVVHSLRNVNLGDLNRDTAFLDVDIWNRSVLDSDDWSAIEIIADNIESLFNNANYPTGNILPTFYRDMRQYVEDSDKAIQHINLTFEIQNYYKGD